MVFEPLSLDPFVMEHYPAKFDGTRDLKTLKSTQVRKDQLKK